MKQRIRELLEGILPLIDLDSDFCLVSWTHWALPSF